MPRANSEFIRQQREEMQLTQEKLAEEAGIGVRTVQVAESGKDKNSSNRTLRSIARGLGVEYEEVLYARDRVGDVLGNESDAFQIWPWSLSDFIRGEAGPGSKAFCSSPEDARFAIKSMRDSWSEHLGRSEGLVDSKGFSKANEQLNHDYQRYEERYLAIWKAHPKTILFSMVEQERSGVCVVLPLTQKAYASIREGESSFMDITVADVLPESQYLILDSAVEIPCVANPHWLQVTNSLSFSLFYLIASLSKNPVAANFRMLGFGASPINLERLGGIGFSPCNVEMPDYKYQICEFGLESEEHSEETLKRSLTTLHYANLFKVFSLTDASLNEKRRMIRRALRLYQRTAKKYADRHGLSQDGSAA